MNQRGGGAILLALAAAVLMLAQVAAPTAPGLATRAPLAPPPPVGTCLTGPTHAVVSCDQLHQQEVVASWMPRAENDPSEPYQRFCPEAAAAYLGDPAPPSNPVWQSPGLHYEAHYFTAPAGERIQWFGWVACVIQSAYSGRYVGSIRGLQKVAQRPSAYGSCAFGYLVPPTFANINCTEPHEVEILGAAGGFMPDSTTGDLSTTLMPAPEILQRQCERLAVALLDTPDPTYENQLVVDIRTAVSPGSLVWVPGDTSEVAVSSGGPASETEIPIGSEQTGTSWSASCLIRAAHLGVLTNSLIGNGAKPLPIQ